MISTTIQRITIDPEPDASYGYGIRENDWQAAIHAK